MHVPKDVLNRFKPFPAITVAFLVIDPRTNNVVHKGRYRLDNDTERRAFGERCHQAIADGLIITTYKQGLKVAV